MGEVMCIIMDDPWPNESIPVKQHMKWFERLFVHSEDWVSWYGSIVVKPEQGEQLEFDWGKNGHNENEHV